MTDQRQRPRITGGLIPGPVVMNDDGSLPPIPSYQETLHGAIVNCVVKQRDERPELVAADRARCNVVEERIEARWGEGLWAFEALIARAESVIGDNWRTELRNHYGWTTKSRALTALLRRCCETSREILTLLRAGLSVGAQARWRTLHELTVTALFISQHGEDLAERFLAHRTIEECKQEEQAARARETRDLVEESPPDDERLRRLRSERDAVIGKYGKAIRDDWGWAASVIKKKGRVTFQDVRKSLKIDVGLKDAHVAVHASAGAPYWSADPDDARWAPDERGILAPAGNAIRELRVAFYAYGSHLDTVVSLPDLVRVSVFAFARLCDEAMDCLFRAAGLRFLDPETDADLGYAALNDDGTT